jgi:hypothetical protein
LGIADELGAVHEDGVADTNERAVSQRNALASPKARAVDPRAVARASVFDVQRGAGA